MSSKLRLTNVNGKQLVISNDDTNTTGITINGGNILAQTSTIASLRAMVEIPSTVYVTGYTTANDNAFGSNFFKWNSTSTVADNGGTIIKLTGTLTGRYELQYSGAVNVKWFGAVGAFGIISSALADVNCAAMQSAFTAGYKVVMVPPGNYSWNPRFMLYNDGTYSQSTRVGVSIPSGVTLLGYGATLTSINTNSDNYDMLSSFKTTGVSIKGFTLIGDRDTNTSDPTVPNDYGFGIDFRDVTDASVEDVISNKMWGDSFYLGIIDIAGTGSNKVAYRNITGINSRRQGLSIAGGQKIIVDGYRFENIVGAVSGPCAGIDIEPNTSALCSDIQLLNGYVSTLNRTILVYKTINLIIDNLQVEDCSVLFPTLADRVYDTSISNVVARGGATSKYGILWQLSKTLVRVTISNCKIGVVSLYPFFMEEDTTASYKWVDVVFNDCAFYVKGAPVSTSIANVSTYGAISFNNTSVLVPTEFTPTETVNLTSTRIISCSNTIWKDCLFDNRGTATLIMDVGVLGNHGNIFSNCKYIPDYVPTSGALVTNNAATAGMTNHLVNWYETGTWIPRFSTTDIDFTSVTYKVQTGKFTRIGNVVYISGSLYTSAVTVGSASGDLVITGLPFTSNRPSALNISQSFNFKTNQPSAGQFRGTTTQARLYFRSAANVNSSTMSFAELNTIDNSNAIEFSGFFLIP